MKVGKKTGDTLVEVMFAVAIFSMVAISAVAVMNSGMSNAQGTLESTMARNEIDAQAEALRFIQSSYVAERSDNSNEGYFANLWHAIVGRANEATDVVTKYNPNSCPELYSIENSRSVQKLNGFVINVRKIGLSDDATESLVTESEKFFSPSTYPRIIYDDDALLDNLTSSEAQRVEGIYVTAVRDPGSTKVEENVVKGSVYYDFYIRTCWYVSGKSVPNTISTVIRLYDPDMIAPSE
ncbi:hypothetical protein IKX64_01605 [Candidatus Saccharibacteria bacterium]|nr:hypothetical protein [Candidatus Saccharibacteria bacterium]